MINDLQLKQYDVIMAV